MHNLRAALFAAGALLLAGRAHAGNGVIIGAEATYSVPMDDTSDRLGPGIGALLGYQIDLKAIKLIPELGVTYYGEQFTIVPRVGGRAVVGWILSPGVYAHFATPVSDAFAAGTIGVDTGLTLDFAVPRVRIGGFGGVLVFGDPLASAPRGPDTNLVFGLQAQLNLGKVLRGEDG